LPEPGGGAALPPLREVIARFGIGARRSLGQHFLFDLNLTRRIAAAAGDLSGATVVEVGPGPGGLTRALLDARARRVVAIERDSRCLAALDDLAAAYPGRLIVIEGDALEIDAASVGGADRPRHIVANLPYNIATPLLLRWLRQVDAFAGMTLMFQKEVAERIAAAPASEAYGRLAVVSQWLCEAHIAFDVPARAFVPPPKVTSSVIRLVPRPKPLAEAEMTALEAVTRAAFGQRRKMLRSALKSLGCDTGALIEAAGVAPTARAEELTVEQFCALARALRRAAQ
jgi:16S rRNA (adenine1518-N6/adenine1519-N6)-dimethyltransferase